MNKGNAPLSSLRLAAFAAMGTAWSSALLPPAVYLPPYVAQHTSLSLATVGLSFMLAQLFAAMLDPLIGISSDALRTRFGRRKPFIIAGIMLVGTGTWSIYWVAADVSALRLGTSMFALYFGWTMIATPFVGWTGELSSDYHERSRIQAYFQTAIALGTILVMLLPVILDQIGQTGDRIRIETMGCFSLVTLTIGSASLLLFFREVPAAAVVTSSSFLKSLRSLASNRLIWRILASDFCFTLGSGLRGSLMLFFITKYVGLPLWVSALFLLQYGLSVFAAPIWLRLAYHIGKHRALVASAMIQAASGFAALGVVPGHVGLPISLAVILGFTGGSIHVMLRSMMADAADDHRLNTGRGQTGTLFSIFNVTSNAGYAAALGLGYPLLAAFGFQPTGTNDVGALNALHIIYAIVPALTLILCAVFVVRFPLNEARLADIKIKLDERDARDAVAAERA